MKIRGVSTSEALFWEKMKTKITSSEDAGRYIPSGDYNLVSTHAHLVDRMYFNGKQKERYFREADFIDLVMQQSTKGKEIIDVGCGTGIHMMLLSDLGYGLSGFDIRNEMVTKAKERNPSRLIIPGDMTQFPLEKKVDGLICMYGAINYIGNEEDINLTIKNFYNHLNKNGVAIIDTREWQNLDEKVHIWDTEDFVLSKRWVKSKTPMVSAYRVFYAIPSEGVMEMEDHMQYFQNSKWLGNKLKQEGFSNVEIYDNYSSHRKFNSASGSYLPVIVAQK